MLANDKCMNEEDCMQTKIPKSSLEQQDIMDANEKGMNEEMNWWISYS